MRFKLGKLPARHDPRLFKFSAFAKKTKLPPHPTSFGHEAVVSDYFMLGNDKYGCCVWSGAAHETMEWTALGGKRSRITTADVLSDYAAVTGFKPSDPNTDQGTDMLTAASYRRKTGIRDAQNKRHRIGAYVSIKTGDPEEHMEAAYLFGAVGIGLVIGANQEEQFSQGKPWDGALGSDTGGHYVPCLGFRDGYFVVVTWGRVQRMTPAFLKANNDQSLCYLSQEFVVNNKSPEGFDLVALQDCLTTLGTA